MCRTGKSCHGEEKHATGKIRINDPLVITLKILVTLLTADGGVRNYNRLRTMIQAKLLGSRVLDRQQQHKEEVPLSYQITRTLIGWQPVTTGEKRHGL